ncbi:hypothetical protein BC938DRAFT_480117 [Jimgerdemannia flammicorona]|uniref:Uncharacterized protein n=1 Tax=Jimgerdemannia flammicorona TaxID=994334 RepID=A0A433QJC9_9FUNG|nr:hypothetical protein BC938DRAFT_480117 [Jimgerdemannia flammicorona]
MDCKGTNVCRLGRLNWTKMPNTIETIACLEVICTVMTNIKATLRIICDKANNVALSNARVCRRKRTDDNDDAIGGCFGNVSGMPAKKRSTEEM